MPIQNRSGKVKICDFTMPELERFRKECNLTKDERLLFELRAEDIPLEQCAEIMNLSLSAIKAKSQKINSKIKRVLFIDF